MWNQHEANVWNTNSADELSLILMTTCCCFNRHGDFQAETHPVDDWFSLLIWAHHTLTVIIMELLWRCRLMRKCFSLNIKDKMHLNTEYSWFKEQDWNVSWTFNKVFLSQWQDKEAEGSDSVESSLLFSDDVEEFSFLWLCFISELEMEQEMDRLIWASSAVM